MGLTQEALSRLADFPLKTIIALELGEPSEASTCSTPMP